MSLSKVFKWDEAIEWRKRSRGKGERVVFTNGCFDLIHMGHVDLLRRAGSMGDRLVVGLNSDKSTQIIKGPERPIRNQAERAEVLAGLKSVDAVVIFDEPDPLRLIVFLEPDILIKGGDWAVENIIGAKEVTGWGGKVFSIPLLPGRSTTGIVETIQKNGKKSL